MKEFLKSLVLATLVILVVGLLGLSYLGGYFEHSQTLTRTGQGTQDDGLQTQDSASSQSTNTQDSNQDDASNLVAETQNLFAKLQAMTGNHDLATTSNHDLQTQQQEEQQQNQQQASQITQPLTPSAPSTTISNDTINWYFSDSNGNRYHWTMPLSSYDAQIRIPTSFLVGTQYLTLPNGTRILAQNYAPLAQEIVSSHEFRNVIDQVYDNAGSDEHFIYEVWYITSEMATYSVDITDSNLTPFEVLTRGEGDCKDKSILIASMLRSSEHTTNWKISLEEMDINNPTDPQTMNHMIVMVDTGQKTYAIESIATPDSNGLNVWAGVSIYGWQIQV